MITVAPSPPLLGLINVIVGAAGSTVNAVALATVPPGVVTLIKPVVAPEGTAAVICVPSPPS